MGKKYFWKGSVFRNFIGRDNFPKASPYFKKMVNSLWQDFEISEIFYVILYLDFQKESVGNPHKVMAKFLEAVVDDVHFIVNLHSFLMPPSLPRQMLPIGKSFAPLPGRANSKTCSSSRHTNNSFSVYLVSSTPQFIAIIQLSK